MARRRFGQLDSQWSVKLEIVACCLAVDGTSARPILPVARCPILRNCLTISARIGILNDSEVVDGPKGVIDISDLRRDDLGGPAGGCKGA